MFIFSRRKTGQEYVGGWIRTIKREIRSHDREIRKQQVNKRKIMGELKNLIKNREDAFSSDFNSLQLISLNFTNELNKIYIRNHLLVFSFINRNYIHLNDKNNNKINNFPIPIIHLILLFTHKVNEKKQKYLFEVEKLLKIRIQTDKHIGSLYKNKSNLSSIILRLNEQKMTIKATKSLRRDELISRCMSRSIEQLPHLQPIYIEMTKNGVIDEIIDDHIGMDSIPYDDSSDIEDYMDNILMEIISMSWQEFINDDNIYKIYRNKKVWYPTYDDIDQEDDIDIMLARLAALK